MKSVNRDSHFKLSQSSKRMLANFSGQYRSDLREQFIAAEIAEEAANRIPYSEDEFFGKAARKQAKKEQK